MNDTAWGPDALPAIVVCAGFTLVFASAEAWKRLGKPDAEWTRKAVHVGCGLIVCAFPWIFVSAWSVAALSSLFFVLLLLARWKHLLPSVQGVDRESWGEVLFPLSTAALALLSWEQRELYLVSMLTLTVADALAALVGRSYGTHQFEVDLGQRKSLQGSAAFFLAAYLSTLLPLVCLGSQSGLASALIALQMAWLVTGFEAISLSGMDNLILPLGAWYLLRQLSLASASWMAIQLSAQAGISLVALALVWRYRHLSFSGLLASQLYIYAAFAYGGPEWAVAPMLGLVALGFVFAHRPQASQAQVLLVYHATLAPLAVLVLNNASHIFRGPLARPDLWPWLGPMHAGLMASSLACVSVSENKALTPWSILLLTILGLAAGIAQHFKLDQWGVFCVAALLQGICFKLIGIWKSVRDKKTDLHQLSNSGLLAAAFMVAFFYWKQP